MDEALDLFLLDLTLAESEEALRGVESPLLAGLVQRRVLLLATLH